MTLLHRLTIRSVGPDPRVVALLDDSRALGIPGLVDAAVADLLVLRGTLDPAALRAVEGLAVDPLLQSASWAEPAPSDDTPVVVETALHPGVTDPVASELLRAARAAGLPVEAVATGRRVELRGTLAEADVDALARRLLANPVIEEWSVGTPIVVRFPEGDHSEDPIEPVPLTGLDDDGLLALDRSRGLSLDLAELHAIRDHFQREGRTPTDVELETLAQTWSEHCAHKTFRARITAEDGTQITPLLRQLRDCTDAIAKPYVLSAFVGNAGIVSFTPERTLAIKAETHNHPSAIEPFGGANTGVGGVIRDVMGAAHRPIATTDVLCFGPPDLDPAALPDGVLHPRLVERGVIAGVADYGNKIGLPTVAGAVLYDERFTANPLVFCGCLGVAEPRPELPGPQPGDRVICIGGRTGRDGLRGATFSSRTMDATTGEVAGASVQIGDPIVEKLLIDVLDEIVDDYHAITDCGAGGLSSAVGEMAEQLGADVDLASVPLKYPGLAPWEIWLSEAQERMVLAVAPSRMPAVVAACDRHGVELTDLGAFRSDGRLVVRHAGTPVLELDTRFLHDGRPQRTMRAVLPSPGREAVADRVVTHPDEVLLGLLAHRNIASKAAVIHRYDHEIRGATAVRPLTGAALDAPADGVVLAEPTDAHGVALGIGVNPWHGEHDPERMAHAVVDEAIRNVVAVGADPDQVALLDNFSWGDPRRETTLGDLVAAVRGCCDAARAYGAPFVSGKDSLNNEYLGSDDQRHAVPPTLVITALAHVPEVARCVTTDLKEPGNVLVLLGSTAPEFAGSHLDAVVGEPPSTGAVPAPDPGALSRYRRLHQAIRAGLVQSCHDLSEGGLAVAVAEMAIGGRCGAVLDALPHDDLATALFSESSGRLLVEVRPGDLAPFRSRFDEQALVLGTVTDEPVLALPGVRPIGLDELLHAFHRVGATS